MSASVARVTAVPGVPTTDLRQQDELPFLPLYFPGLTAQLLQVDVEGGLWVIRTRFEAGTTIQRHRHTGEVYAVTFTGSWFYLEYPTEINRPGSYLYEPAGSVHTLHVPPTNTEVTDAWFAIRGANLNLDDDGNVESFLDAGTVLQHYLEAAEEAGLPTPRVIGM